MFRSDEFEGRQAHFMKRNEKKLKRLTLVCSQQICFKEVSACGLASTSLRSLIVYSKCKRLLKSYALCLKRRPPVSTYRKTEICLWNGDVLISGVRIFFWQPYNFKEKSLFNIFLVSPLVFGKQVIY